MSVIFASCKPFAAAEDINTLYNAWSGYKTFARLNSLRMNPEIMSGEYSVLVTDEVPVQSPGKVVLIRSEYEGCKLGGLDQPHPHINKENCDLLTYVINASENTVQTTAGMYGIDESKVLPLGKPRTDLFFNEATGASFGNKRVYLYIPTYRDDDEPPTPDMDWELIDECLNDKEVFVVKSYKKLDHRFRHIIDIPSTEPSSPYLIGCDIFITDYSSIMFDAHLLNKPVVLFEKNPGYLNIRGMYLNYPYDYASRFCTNELDLLAVINEADVPQEPDILAKQYLASACDGHSTERIIGLLRNMG